MPEVVALSRRALRVIHQNIGVSVFLNVVSVVAAAQGWISPIGAVILALISGSAQALRFFLDCY